MCRSIGFTDKSPEKDPNSSGAEADTSDDSSSEDNWKIIDSSDNDIDKAIEENATKQNLTVVNIKNIIHVSEHCLNRLNQTSSGPSYVFGIER